jgi:hypothetical protein
LLHKRIDSFREGGRTDWSLHLGFDLRDLERLLPPAAAHSSRFFGFNQFSVFERFSC